MVKRMSKTEITASEDDILNAFYNIVIQTKDATLCVDDVPCKTRFAAPSQRFHIERIHAKAPYSKIMRAFRRILHLAQSQRDDVRARIVDDVIYISTICPVRHIDRQS
jgi:hypothetical protein